MKKNLNINLIIIEQNVYIRINGKKKEKKKRKTRGECVLNIFFFKALKMTIWVLLKYIKTVKMNETWDGKLCSKMKCMYV